MMNGERLHTESRLQRGRYLGGLVLALLVVSVIATKELPIQKSVPGYAFGSKLLLHGERAFLIFGGLFVLAVVVVRAFEGRLPFEFSMFGTGAKWKEVDAELELSVEDIRATINDQGKLIEQQIVALEALEEELDRVWVEVEQLKKRRIWQRL